MSNIANALSIYGFPEECKKFDERHPLWQGVLQNLQKTFNVAFAGRQTKGPEGRLVYCFGRLCVEDFMEILLVCYHGYGAAASKLLRSMYELTVTLYYLHENPDEADIFMDYHLVQQNKLLDRLIETFGESVLPAKDVTGIMMHTSFRGVRSTNPESRCK